MRSLSPTSSRVTGTTGRRIARILLEQGSWDIDCELGSPGAISTATMVVRPIGGATALTFTSSSDPTRTAPQRLVLEAPAEIEFVVSNSSASEGVAAVDDIRISEPQTAQELVSEALRRVKRPIGGEQ